MEQMEIEERRGLRNNTIRRQFNSCCSLKSCSIGVICFLTGAVLAVAVSRGIKAYHATTKSPEVRCATPNCRSERLTSAYAIMHRLDEKTSPCDDFYQFACGSYKKNIEKFEHIDVFDTGSIDEQNILYLRAFIPRINQTIRIRPYQLAKHLYEICMESDSTTKRQMITLMEILTQVHGWPVLEGNRWDEELFKWEKLVYAQQQLGFPSGSFLRFGFTGNLADNSKLIIQIEQPDLEFSCERYKVNIEDDIGIEAYINYMVNVAVELGADRKEATKELENVFNFEKQLAEIAEPDSSRRENEGRYHLMTIKELEKTYPNIDWKTLLMRYKPDYEYRDDDKFMIKNKTYIGLFEQLITKTPKRVLANYGVWKMLEFAVPYIQPSIRRWSQLYNTFRIIPGDVSGHIVWLDCIYEIKKHFSQITDSMLIGGTFDHSSIEKVTPIFDTMKQELIDLLKTIDWLDEHSKNAAIEKVEALTYLLGYPKEILDVYKLTSLFDGLTLVDGDYFQSILNIEKFFSKKTAGRMRKPYDMSSWELLPPWTEVNAYNIADQNKIMILTGYLRKGSYHPDRPNYMNYGLVGATIGHELFHALDNIGVMHDKHGHIKYWMSSESRKIFQEKMDCLIEQYDNYELTPLKEKINGNLTISENMADAYGTRLTYLSYKNWYEKHGPDDLLPEMPYTPYQLFWISYANGFCKDYSEKDLREYVSDTHPPHHIRVVGSLSNIPEFAADFECPAHSKMNPPNKCTYW